MKEQNRILIDGLNLVSDFFLTLLTYAASVYLRLDVLDGIWTVNLLGGHLLAIMVGYCAGICVLYYLTRVYTREHYSRMRSIGTVILLDNLAGTMALFTLLFLVHEEYFSRGVIILFFFLSTAVIIAKHKLSEALSRYIHRRGLNCRRVLLVGSGPLACRYAIAVRGDPAADLAVDGYLGRSRADLPEKYLGDYDDLRRVLDELAPDEVVIALESDEESYLKKILTDSAREGVRVKIIPTYNAYIPSNPVIDVVGDAKLIDINATPMDNLALAFVKRLADIVLSLLGIILLSPILLITAVGVKLSSPGPVFFIQERVGKNKKLFPMIKFRSMRVNADEKTGWSKNEDPRKTAFGSLIRKTSIDELPQLFNVLAGQMSLVGPRPEVPFHVNHFKDEIPRYLVRQQVRPGITGWAQVNGLRGDTSIEKRVEYDLWYIDNWSLRLDFEILVRTVLFALVNDEKLNTSGGKSEERHG